MVGIQLLILAVATATSLQASEEVAQSFLNKYDVEAKPKYNALSNANWDFQTNITDHNQQAMIAKDVEIALFNKEQGDLAAELLDDNTGLSVDTIRQLEMIADIGSAKLGEEELTNYKKGVAEMETIYSNGKYCMNGDQDKCLSLNPDLNDIMARSRDYNDLSQAWTGWRDVSGKKMRELYVQYAATSNKVAKLNDQPDMGAYWREGYEDEHFVETVDKIYEGIKPLYLELHAYVRKRLFEYYGEKFVNKRAPIPAHLLGNMWSQTWSNIKDIVSPFKDVAPVDISDVLQKKTIREMFDMSEEFFTSLGMEKMTDTFWENSILVKPTDRDFVCHASAWDFYNEDDYRIKMCTVKTMEDFGTVHHEMGHIVYDMLYSKQPLVYRGGANPGFHEAVGDLISLSVMTPQHLKTIHLLDEYDDTEDANVNFLLNMALDKIAFVPFGLLIDSYRWKIFDGSIESTKLNEEWWKMRTAYQGIIPPVERSEDDFDAGAKFHVPSSVPYIRYFISFVIQFQFHKRACELAKHVGPLHTCDIFGSVDAGDAVMSMLELGKSKPWQDALEEMIPGTRHYSTDAIMDYFEPLHKWLVKQNADEVKGWPDAAWKPEGYYGGSSLALPSLTLITLLLVVTLRLMH